MKGSTIIAYILQSFIIIVYSSVDNCNIRISLFDLFLIYAFKITEKMGSESDDRNSLSRDSVFSEEAGSSSGLVNNSSCSNSATSSRESSFDDFRSDSCSSDFCDDELESDSHRGVMDALEASSRALCPQPNQNQNDLLFQTLQCRWLVLRDQLLQIESEEARQYLFENAHLMLDQELQPISPATDIPESIRIFEEHKMLAKEYLQAQMEIEDLLQTKADLEKQLAEQNSNGPRMNHQDSMKEWRELQSENDSLVQFHQQLKRQLELIKGRGRNHQMPPSPDLEEPGWVIVRREGRES